MPQAWVTVPIDFASLESSLARAVRGVVDIVRETVRADAQKGGAE